MDNKIYINGEPHTILETRNGGIFVDHPAKPYRNCAFHRMDTSTLRAIRNGATIYTNGNKYSTKP